MRTRDLRTYFNEAKGGWVVDVPWILPEEALKTLVRLMLKGQQGRLAGMPPGPAKDRFREKMLSLQIGGVQQNLVGERGNGKGDLLLFAGKYEPAKLISIPRGGVA